VAKVKIEHGFSYAIIPIGSLVFTDIEEGKELKDQEKEYFQYGRSTMIAVFPKDTVTRDQDLKANSKICVETIILIDEIIGSYNAFKAILVLLFAARTLIVYSCIDSYKAKLLI
jgi:hypothetical protein